MRRLVAIMRRAAAGLVAIALLATGTLATGALSTGVRAQTATAAGGLGSHDASQPIEIVADRLTVEQAEGRAVFLGNVLAEQGEMLLRADRLVVYYALGDDADGEDGNAGGSAATGQAIRRIEVAGNVTIASAEETAVGDQGFYDVTGAMIELAGNVVLTRDANVIRGDLLEIDVEQQRAIMTSDPGRPAGERVRALFRPAEDGEG